MNYQTRIKIREMYQGWLPDIKKHYPCFNVYEGNWTSWIKPTPIEKNVWHDIRIIGLPFVPQFPVAQYFLDFADPVRKIGIEVDGKKWHQDLYKDKQRQREIENLGWTIVRIPSRKTHKDLMNYLEHKNLKDFYENCFEGILRKIKEDLYN